jgi:phospholipid/cholesterol/gamma-HCH transport system permease protein
LNNNLQRTDHDGRSSELGSLALSRLPDGLLLVKLSGNWTSGATLPSFQDVKKEVESKPGVKQIAFDASGLGDWDSKFLTFLMGLKDWSDSKSIRYVSDGLPDGAKRLVALASAVPERKGARQEERKEPLLSRFGAKGMGLYSSLLETLEFLGAIGVALGRLFRGKATFRPRDLWQFLLESGAQALPIVSLISLLVGLILAFVGAIQLRLFGAEIFVADLVGIGMVRVMGAIMTGIIMAGRTGAAYAAQLGTMQVNEEIDALQTLGVQPVEFLVLPRMLALAIMMPLLCIYADIMGILGGLIVGVTMLDLDPIQYLMETQLNLRLSFVWIGLFHAAVFGVIIALSGCLRGMQCGRSASAVGEATTSAVVTSIVSIIVATAVITIACEVLHI